MADFDTRAIATLEEITMGVTRIALPIRNPPNRVRHLKAATAILRWRVHKPAMARPGKQFHAIDLLRFVHSLYACGVVSSRQY